MQDELDLSNVLDLLESSNREDVELAVTICEGQGWTKGMMFDQLKRNKMNSQSLDFYYRGRAWITLDEIAQYSIIHSTMQRNLMWGL